MLSSPHVRSESIETSTSPQERLHFHILSRPRTGTRALARPWTVRGSKDYVKEVWVLRSERLVGLAGRVGREKERASGNVDRDYKVVLVHSQFDRTSQRGASSHATGELQER
jgi:hypothetical protein